MKEHGVFGNWCFRAMQHASYVWLLARVWNVRLVAGWWGSGGGRMGEM